MSGIRHHSMAMVGFDDDTRPSQTARGDKNNLPLGAVWATNLTVGNSAQALSQSKPKASPGTQPELPKCPAGQPIMVLFPGTLHMAVFALQPSPALIASGVLVLMALIASMVSGAGFVSSAGSGVGIVAGVVVGLGMRLRHVGGRGWVALAALGVALLGGGRASLALGFVLMVSTLWRHGWWLYLQPELAPLVFFICGTTMDVAFGFVLSSLIQVHCTTPPKPSSSPPAEPPAPAILRSSGNGAVDDRGIRRGELAWGAVTPPGLGSRGGRI